MKTPTAMYKLGLHRQCLAQTTYVPKFNANTPVVQIYK